MNNNICHSSLIEAAENGCTECVKLLVDKESGPTMGCESGPTMGCESIAIICAAQNGHTECVKLLIPYEACLTDKNGEIGRAHV